MRAVILAVGDEVLEGDTINTNAAFVAGRLIDIGYNIAYHKVIADDPALIEACTIEALGASDLLITTGGLGPTKDDLTKHVVCSALGLEMYFDQEVEERIRSRFMALHSRMSENNSLQCELPVGGIVLQNNNGTAPGVYVERGEKMIAMLPGPPSELEPMFDDYLAPILTKKSSKAFYEKYYGTIGLGEALIEQKVRALGLENESYMINTYLTDCGVLFKATGRGANPAQARLEVAKREEALLELLGNHLYCAGEKKEEIWDTVFKLLCERKLTLSAAESVTGGLISSLMTAKSGASRVFYGSAVTYTNEAKTAILGVKPETIASYGVVSEQVAEEMAEGARKAYNTDFAVGVTGYAGPSGGDEFSPVGTVCYCVNYRGEAFTTRASFKGSRKRIQMRAVAAIFKQMYEILQK